MKLTKKGKKIITTMKGHYGTAKGKEVFEKMIEEGKLTGVVKGKKKK